MQCRFVIYIACFLLIDFYCFYYIALFNLIYEKSSESWLQGAFISFAMDICGLSFILPLLQAAFRTLSRRVPSLRYNYINNK